MERAVTMLYHGHTPSSALEGSHRPRLTHCATCVWVSTGWTWYDPSGNAASFPTAVAVRVVRVVGASPPPAIIGPLAMPGPWWCQPASQHFVSLCDPARAVYRGTAWCMGYWGGLKVGNYRHAPGSPTKQLHVSTAHDTLDVQLSGRPPPGIMNRNQIQFGSVTHTHLTPFGLGAHTHVSENTTKEVTRFEGASWEQGKASRVTRVIPNRFELPLHHTCYHHTAPTSYTFSFFSPNLAPSTLSPPHLSLFPLMPSTRPIGSTALDTRATRC